MLRKCTDMKRKWMQFWFFIKSSSTPGQSILVCILVSGPTNICYRWCSIGMRLLIRCIYFNWAYPPQYNIIIIYGQLLSTLQQRHNLQSGHAHWSKIFVFMPATFRMISQIYGMSCFWTYSNLDEFIKKIILDLGRLYKYLL